MTSIERPLFNTGLAVERRLFALVRAVCVVDRRTFTQQGKQITEWNAPGREIGLRDTLLTKPLGSCQVFSVVRATLVADTPDTGYQMRIGRPAGQAVRHPGLAYPEFSYGGDFIAEAVADAFDHYLRQHPHAECLAAEDARDAAYV